MLGALQTEASNFLRVNGEIFADLGIPLVAMVSDIKYVVKKMSLKFHSDKGGATEQSSPPDYFQSLHALKERCSDPTRYFFLVMEMQAMRMTHGVPPPRPIISMKGERARPPPATPGCRNSATTSFPSTTTHLHRGRWLVAPSGRRWSRSADDDDHAHHYQCGTSGGPGEHRCGRGAPANR